MAKMYRKRRVRRGRRIKSAMYSGYKRPGGSLALPIHKRVRRVSRTTRKRTSSYAVTNKRKRVDEGPGIQWTKSSKKTGRRKVGYSIVKAISMANAEQYTVRKRRVKNFDNNGIVPANKLDTGLRTLYPLWAISLNDNSPSQTNSYPFRQLFVTNADGRIGWSGQMLLTASGAEQTTGYTEKLQTFNQAQDKMLWRSSNIKMNLWGARNKPIRWTVQICTVKDHKVSPFNAATLANVDLSSQVVNTESQQTWEEMLKHYHFNPISTINWHNGSHIKVLKQFDITLQPNSTIDGDADARVHQLNWYTQWDRMCVYTDVMETLKDDVNNPAVSFVEVSEVNNGIINRTAFPRDKSTVFLLIRASDFGVATAFDAIRHGSFDFDIRTNFTVAV